MKNIYEILEDFRSTSESTTELGKKFEHLVKFILINDIRFKDQYEAVYLWDEFPLRETRDIGIDIVAKIRNEETYCAIQCKCYSPDTTLTKENINSFFTAAGKKLYTKRLIFCTTNLWSKHAEDSLKDQTIPVSRILLEDMENGSIDWAKFDKAKFLAPQKVKNVTRDHQKEAIKDVLKGFEDHNRGKMIMACGTGKTFTSLRIAENVGKRILFLAPSISLVSQTLNEWLVQSEQTVNSLVVCSDITVKGEQRDFHTYDIIEPPTTDPKKIAKIAKHHFSDDELNVIFSTYQSLEVVVQAQKEFGLAPFDLVICDEAHRTTGVTAFDEEDSHFTLVHDENELKAVKRLYMTATPKYYAESAKKKAKGYEATVYSMDDADKYGPEFHRLGFGKAVERDLLSDYKVMVIGIDPEMAKEFEIEKDELKIEDETVKILGCWSGLSKNLVNPEADSHPMRRAVAFAGSIKNSKHFADIFKQTVDLYLSKKSSDSPHLKCETRHVDGEMSSALRQTHLRWLKEDTSSQGNLCRILSNARCLSEGIDVPTLDAVLFLNPRNSMVDIVQSVGRAMRKAPGKKFGYIIIPIAIPFTESPEDALDNNDRYKIVWDVCQALRAHDDRFNATVNQLKFKTPQQKIEVIKINLGEADPNAPISIQDATHHEFLKLEKTWETAILGKIAERCGERDYWTDWAKDVAEIAEHHQTLIQKWVETGDVQQRLAFTKFMASLRQSINPSISDADAIEMLAQHLITKPIFDALFKDYAFSQGNPVSQGMEMILDHLDNHALEAEQVKLEKFYQSIRRKIEGINNAQGRQAIIKELYDHFFNEAFPKMADRLGIVYTPIELVDFIIHSVDYALHTEFKKSLNDPDVNILDPFTGTGTFIVRLLQSGLIARDHLLKKYQANLHANEIVLLAYYIASINIESALHDLLELKDYLPFDGTILVDTFQMREPDSSKVTGKQLLGDQTLKKNHERSDAQNNKTIEVIIGNPPYRSGQGSENDENKNLKYPHLDDKIGRTYVQSSIATRKASLYDNYARAYRWATDRIGSRGIVSFVSNGSFIDAGSFDGFRKQVLKDYTTLYIFNLRGDARSRGELRRKEGGTVFGSGSKTSIAISVLIKNPHQKEPKLYYHDIGDYLSREDKLKKIAELKSIAQIPWTSIIPNTEGDWINQRDTVLPSWLPLAVKDKEKNTLRVFELFSNGFKSNRDNWVTNFSSVQLAKNMKGMIDFYNAEVDRIGHTPKPNMDPQKISWSRGLLKALNKKEKLFFKKSNIREALYRPFTKRHYYYVSRPINEEPYQNPRIFPFSGETNLSILVPGNGNKQGFSCLMTSILPDIHCHPIATLHFPLRRYDTEKQKSTKDRPLLIDTETESNLSDRVIQKASQIYKKPISDEDFFYYCYGILSSNEYRDRFQDSLSKILPHIPLAKDFDVFMNAGRALAQLHNEYETVKPYPLLQEGPSELIQETNPYHVTKMKIDKKDQSILIYNARITLKGIPPEAYAFKISGRSPLEWVVDQYQITTDKDSGLTDDPNDWCVEHQDPMYILNLVKRSITVAVESLKIIGNLPPIEERPVKWS